ncbi:MAG: hypothetical protein ACXWBN_16860 [Acidimicrobiales bacterium]
MSTRIKREELRDLLLREGVALLLEEGVQVGLGSVTFPRVFERVEASTGRRVTAASVYERLWASQSDFQWEVLAVLVEDASTLDDRTRNRVRRILSTADRSSEAGRLGCLRELCQVVVQQHVLEGSRRHHYRIVLAAVAAVSASEVDRGRPEGAPEGVDRVRQALRDYVERETEQLLDLYMEIGGSLGLRTRAPLELRQFALAVGALGEGIALRLKYFPEYAQPIAVPSSPDRDEDEMWSLAGFGVEALVNAMIEVDPDWPGPDA